MSPKGQAHTPPGNLWPDTQVLWGAHAFAPTPVARPPTQHKAQLTGDARVAGGIIGLALVAANRIFLAGELAFGDQSRADLLAVAATMGLILDGLSQVDVETRESEVVQLRGERGRGV